MEPADAVAAAPPAAEDAVNEEDDDDEVVVVVVSGLVAFADASVVFPFVLLSQEADVVAAAATAAVAPAAEVPVAAAAAIDLGRSGMETTGLAVGRPFTFFMEMFPSFFVMRIPAPPLEAVAGLETEEEKPIKFAFSRRILRMREKKINIFLFSC